ncbi:uncharacterized protein I206_107699 [Kwoniella pini CBS 10737]|uniref:SWIB domain-containing protein n=1 Tax=Kwoniella pini CBS 10737 TaxID=1296096 RepID=A0A1B9HY09_9TREE|nr:uncharacterized protein I206_06033 [Kwoniella pini CBS 10737]OCF48165.1 hypothetical protein I206_06033 [Kwoniella pini CBS 10737]
MSVAQAGPSHTPTLTQTPSYSQQPQGDNKRRAEVDADSVRRLKHPRPPLPPPHVLQALVPDSPAFTELLKLEQKLDWTLLRKKAEINDTLGKPTRVKRTLRIFISNTAHDQPWQKPQSQSSSEQTPSTNAPAETAEDATASIEEKKETDGDVTMNESAQPPVKEETKVETLDEGVDVNTGKGIAGWVMKIEGRLLDVGNTRLDRTKRKFSTFLKSVIVEFDNREAPTFPEGNIVEWHAQNVTPPLDGFEILRRGDQNVNARIIIHLNHSPDRFKVLQPLADLISIKEGTRSEIINGVWKLIKVCGAQDKDDGTIIKAIGGLEKIFPQGTETIAFHQIPEMATRYLTHPDPIVIPYTIQVDKDFNFHPKCFDIPFEVEDPLKSKMSSLVQSFEGKEGKEIVQLEDKVGELAYFARDIKQKRDFLESFAANPQSFIQNWLAVQARDLDQMLGYQIGTPGLNGGNIREEDLRRSDLFSLPWVDEAVTVHESARMEQERRLKASQSQTNHR